MIVATANSNWVLAIPFGAIGIPVLLTGAVMLKTRIVARRKGALIQAEVVDGVVHHVPIAAQRAAGGMAASTVTPVFRYRTANGEERFARLDHQARQRLRSQGYRLRYPIGARQLVRIDPARPEIAYDDTLASMFVFPGLLLFSGMLMTLLSLGIWFGAQT